MSRATRICRHHPAIRAAQSSTEHLRPQGWSRKHRQAARVLGTTFLMAVAAGCTALPAEQSGVEAAPMTAAEPDYVLALESVGADEPTDPHGVLDLLGLSTDELRRYEDFRSMSVWSGETRNGTSCLLVARLDQGFREGLSTDECSPDGSDAVADLRWSGGPYPKDPVFADLPVGSRIRFVLTGDHVEVYVTAADPTASRG